MADRLLKEEVINFRVDAETKEVMRKAANLSGLDLSAYIISRSKEAAIEDIIRHGQANRILLNEADFMAAKAVVDSPAQITPKLKSAMEKHFPKK